MGVWGAIANKMEASQETCFCAKTRSVRGSDYSPAIALSEEKYIFSSCDATQQKIILYNHDIDLVNDNVYAKFG